MHDAETERISPGTMFIISEAESRIITKYVYQLLLAPKLALNLVSLGVS